MESHERCLTPLEKARRARGLSQTELARRAGVDQARISRAEAGGTLSRKEAEALARFFGWPFHEMHVLYPERYPDITYDFNVAKAS